MYVCTLGWTIWGLILCRGKGFFLFQNVLGGCWAHPASYSVGAMGNWGEAAEAWSWPYRSRAGDKIVLRCTSVPPYAFMVCTWRTLVTLLCLALPYLTLPFLNSPNLTLPYLTSPHLTSPHLTSPHLTSPYRTLPYLTLPYLPATLFHTSHEPHICSVTILLVRPSPTLSFRSYERNLTFEASPS